MKWTNQRTGALHPGRLDPVGRERPGRALAATSSARSGEGVAARLPGDPARLRVHRARLAGRRPGVHLVVGDRGTLRAHDRGFTANGHQYAILVAAPAGQWSRYSGLVTSVFDTFQPAE